MLILLILYINTIILLVVINQSRFPSNEFYNINIILAKDENYSNFFPQKVILQNRISDFIGTNFQHIPVPTDLTTSLFHFFFHRFCKKSRFGAQPFKKNLKI